MQSPTLGLLCGIIIALFSLGLAKTVIPEPGFGCYLACPRGQVLDHINCRCRPINIGPVCPLVRCPQRYLLPCLVYKKDSNGCQTCQCQCYNFQSCPKNCQYGTTTVTTHNGCKVCRCKPKPPVCTALQTCKLYCPNGFLKDKNGCEICRCKPTISPCPPYQCLIACRWGRVRDANGCSKCECKPRPLCPPVCEIYCPYGNVLDRNGCKTCKCKSGPIVRPPICGPVCAIYCPYGNVLDSRGCKTCSCKPGPGYPRDLREIQ